MWSLRQAVFGALALLLASRANADSDGLVAPVRRKLAPQLAAPTVAAALQVRLESGAISARTVEKEQLIQQASHSFSSMLAQATLKASRSVQQLQQSVEQLQQSLVTAQLSADSAIASVRSSADSRVLEAAASASTAIASAQAAAPSMTYSYALPTPAASPANAVTVTVTATIVTDGGTPGSGDTTAMAATLPAETLSSAADADQPNGKDAQQPSMLVFDVCATPGKILVIVGSLLGAVGLLALGFVIWNTLRRRSSGSGSEFPTSGGAKPHALGSEKMQAKPGFMDKWKYGRGDWYSLKSPSSQSDFKDERTARPSRTKALLKGSISKPIMISMWPGFRKQNDDEDRLSFQDIGDPSMPTTVSRSRI